MTAAELDRHRYVRVLTYRRDGREVATPVWFAASGGKLYVFSAGEAGKVKRLRTPLAHRWRRAMLGGDSVARGSRRPHGSSATRA